MSTDPVLQIHNLTTRFRSQGNRYLHAVDDVTISLAAGEIVGLVGESGCGKSTLGRSIVGLEQPSSGQVLLDGKDIGSLRGRQLRAARRAIQYVFQDPYSSLNDRQTIGETLNEALLIGQHREPGVRQRMTADLLDKVGLPSSASQRYARELSGGQRQRVAIARALAVEPRVLICDEPVSALDLSVRAQVMNLLLDLRRDLDIACLFIAHDLALVRQAATRVYVMYLGKIVEAGPSGDVYGTPSHPYTQLLLASVPSVDPRVERTRVAPEIAGEIPSPLDPPSGCRFRTRCPLAAPECGAQLPPALAVTENHTAACIRAMELGPSRLSAQA